MKSNMNFETLKAITIKRLDENLVRLQGYCEKYPHLVEFVELITSLLTNDSLAEHTQKRMIAEQLSRFVWQLTGYNICSDHYGCDWANELNSFIGNYFLDDSYFKLEPTDSWGHWQVSNCFEQRSSQDPTALILAAKENVEHLQHLEEIIGRVPYASLKLIPSGVVETQLALKQNSFTKKEIT